MDNNILPIIAGIILFIAAGLSVTLSLTNNLLTLKEVTNQSLEMAAIGGSAGGGFNGTVNITRQADAKTSGNVITPGTLELSNNTGLLRLTTDYTVDESSGTATVITNYTSGALNASFNYEGLGYITGSTTRTIVSLTGLFVAIGAILYIVKEFNVI